MNDWSMQMGWKLAMRELTRKEYIYLKYLGNTYIRSFDSEEMLLAHARLEGYTHMSVAHYDGVVVTFWKQFSPHGWTSMCVAQNSGKSTFTQFEVANSVFEPEEVQFVMTKCPWTP